MPVTAAPLATVLADDIVELSKSETYVMLVAGMALMGIVVRRRKGRNFPR